MIDIRTRASKYEELISSKYLAKKFISCSMLSEEVANSGWLIRPTTTKTLCELWYKMNHE